MKKASTLIYSIHNLASKAKNDIQDVNDLSCRNEFVDIYNMLDQTNLYDVRQEVVNRILSAMGSL